MKKTYIILTVIAGLFLSVYACNKKKIEDIFDLRNKNALFAGLKTLPQKMSVQAGADTTIMGNDSTILHFYPNSFKDAAGNIITSGTISIELTEMYTPREMVLNRTVTTSGDKLLKSGGQVNIIATKDGKEVFANKYAIGFHSSTSSKETMSLFYGDNNNPDSVVTWTSGSPLIPGVTANGTITSDSAYRIIVGSPGGFDFKGGYTYLFTGCTNFHFVNCDLLYDPKVENTTLTVVMPDDSYRPENTQIFIVLPQANSATMGDTRQEYNKETHTFVMGNHGNLVPVGMDYYAVIIAKKEDGLFYFQMVKGVITKGLTIHADPIRETAFNIQARLAGMY